jgi:hypothetical protein
MVGGSCGGRLLKLLVELQLSLSPLSIKLLARDMVAEKLVKEIM